ncbi:hypothetical protein NDU88_007160 [Pleurodeles waltl]|uniref:Uncharacterized protein n=1 Tax=Pleurodeles waltl TaxID=8319 RepID=A0AAV7WGA0_PLEWA|nr:hypothetical protein NDU88_007160 [Pleurodeles waltl]
MHGTPGERPENTALGLVVSARDAGEPTIAPHVRGQPGDRYLTVKCGMVSADGSRTGLTPCSGHRHIVCCYPAGRWSIRLHSQKGITYPVGLPSHIRNPRDWDHLQRYEARPLIA